LGEDVDEPEGANEVDVIREYRMGNKYYRQFTLPQVIDQSRIK